MGYSWTGKVSLTIEQCEGVVTAYTTLCAILFSHSVMLTFICLNLVCLGLGNIGFEKQGYFLIMFCLY